MLITIIIITHSSMYCEKKMAAKNVLQCSRKSKNAFLFHLSCFFFTIEVSFRAYLCFTLLYRNWPVEKKSHWHTQRISKQKKKTKKKQSTALSKRLFTDSLVRRQLLAKLLFILKTLNAIFCVWMMWQCRNFALCFVRKRTRERSQCHIIFFNVLC